MIYLKFKKIIKKWKDFLYTKFNFFKYFLSFVFKEIKEEQPENILLTLLDKFKEVKEEQ